MDEQIRFFNIEGEDLVSYDPRIEAWFLNGDHEGQMSTKLAGQIMACLRRSELTPEDASALRDRSSHATGERK